MVKNLVLISAGVLLRATVRGGEIVPDPASRRPGAHMLVADTVGV